MKDFTRDLIKVNRAVYKKHKNKRK